MGNTIWKYDIVVEDYFELEMPEGSQVLHVDTQFGEPVLWARVDPNRTKTTHRFAVRGTGHNLHEDLDSYLGSFQLLNGRFVGHVFSVSDV